MQARMIVPDPPAKDSLFTNSARVEVLEVSVVNVEQKLPLEENDKLLETLYSLRNSH